MNLELQDKVAIVTGASAGIGLATSRLFLDEGACVAMLARGEERLHAGKRFAVDLQPHDCARTAEAMGGWGCNVGSAEEFAPALREALAQDGPALVNLDLHAIGPMAVPFSGAARLVPEPAAVTAGAG